MRTLLSLTLLSVLGVARAAEPDGPLKVVMLSGAEEYASDISLDAFKAELERYHPVRCTVLKARGTTELPGLEALEDADAAVFFTRRLTLDEPSLARIKAYVASKKPIVAIRTASHGFQNWLEFDKQILGGNYTGHLSHDVTVRAGVITAAKNHPVVDGVRLVASLGGLYKTGPLAADATALLIGAVPNATEPAAWVREADGRRVFYTSLGTPGDFQNAAFKRLLTNALAWAANRKLVPPGPALPDDPAKPEGTLRLALRSRGDASAGATIRAEEIPIAETAIVICDMWDRHWCRGATRRADVIAEKMNTVVKAARAKGVTIIHAPSECMDFYADLPQRRRMQLAPPVAPPKPREHPDPPLPIDDSDGGCDTGDPMYIAWTRQNPKIEIGPDDGISDNGREIHNYFHKRGIKRVIVMGVHTNMCILNRTFAIKQLTRWGYDCVLARDLTDTMYNPAMPPKLPHDQGTNLVIEHIERHWCPSTTSDEILSGLPGD